MLHKHSVIKTILPIYLHKTKVFNAYTIHIHIFTPNVHVHKANVNPFKLLKKVFRFELELGGVLPVWNAVGFGEMKINEFKQFSATNFSTIKLKSSFKLFIWRQASINYMLMMFEHDKIVDSTAIAVII